MWFDAYPAAEAAPDPVFRTVVESDSDDDLDDAEAAPDPVFRTVVESDSDDDLDDVVLDESPPEASVPCLSPLIS
jgi:hypothetical protein